MSKRQSTAASGFDDEPVEETKVPSPPAKRSAAKSSSSSSSSSSPESQPDNFDDRADGIYEGVMVYGRRRYNPFCPNCTVPKDGTYVMTKVTSTQGPVAFVKCPTEGCSFKTKVSRPLEKASDVFRRQQSVAARPDMG